MFKKTSEVDRLVNACCVPRDSLGLDVNLADEIVNRIQTEPGTCKPAVKAIKKKIKGKDVSQQLQALELVDHLIRSCGSGFRLEVAIRLLRRMVVFASRQEECPAAVQDKCAALIREWEPLCAAEAREYSDAAASLNMRQYYSSAPNTTAARMYPAAVPLDAHGRTAGAPIGFAPPAMGMPVHPAHAHATHPNGPHAMNEEAQLAAALQASLHDTGGNSGSVASRSTTAPVAFNHVEARESGRLLADMLKESDGKIQGNDTIAELAGICSDNLDIIKRALESDNPPEDVGDMLSVFEEIEPVMKAYMELKKHIAAGGQGRPVPIPRLQEANNSTQQGDVTDQPKISEPPPAYPADTSQAQQMDNLLIDFSDMAASAPAEPSSSLTQNPEEVPAAARPAGVITTGVVKSVVSNMQGMGTPQAPGPVMAGTSVSQSTNGNGTVDGLPLEFGGKPSPAVDSMIELVKADANADVKYIEVSGNLAEQIDVAFQKLCVSNEGVLFENKLLQIGVRIGLNDSDSAKGPTKMCMTMFLGNKTNKPVEGFTCHVQQPEGIRVSVAQASQDIQAGKQAKCVIDFSCSGAFAFPPACRMQWLYKGERQGLRLRLPVSPNRFIKGFALPADQFGSGWSALKEEHSVAVSAAAIEQTKLRTGAQPIDGIEGCWAGTLVTEKGVEGVLIRSVKLDDTTSQVTVRSRNSTLSTSVGQALAGTWAGSGTALAAPDTADRSIC